MTAELHREAQAPTHGLTLDLRLRQLVARALEGAELMSATPLKPDSVEHEATTKGAGYGAPLRLEVLHEGVIKSLCLHSATANPFGHERRADRAAEMLVAADTFELLPLHTRVLDVGAYRGASFVSLRDTGEFYLLTEYAEGRPYADDLRRIARTGVLQARDVERVDRLAQYLAGIHACSLFDASLYARSARDLLGSGEGIFGIVDGYPEPTEGIDTARLTGIETACLEWRWRLKRSTHRLVRIHGDFHPFNVLFDGDSLHLLDASRGSAGDAADDVAAMAVNYIFFASFDAKLWRGAFQHLWRRFWDCYLRQSKDGELLEVVQPYLAWRCLVLANPVWYPEMRGENRARLFDFINATLALPRFDPELAQSIFA
ncbi:MAG: phosphotransferase [Polyangiaceae bacterium]